MKLLIIFSISSGTISLIVTIFTAIICLIALVYQNKTYKNTTFLMKSDDAYILYLRYIIRKLFYVERFLYAYRRIRVINGFKSQISDLFFMGLQIDLNPFDNNIFYSNGKLFDYSIKLKERLNKINESINYLYLNHKDFDISQKEIERHIHSIHFELLCAYNLWQDLIQKGSEMKLSKFEKYFADLVKDEILDPEVFDQELKSLKYDTGLYHHEISEKEQLEEVQEINKEYHYKPIFGSGILSKLEYLVIINFDRYYSTMKSNLVKINDNDNYYNNN